MVVGIYVVVVLGREGLRWWPRVLTGSSRAQSSAASSSALVVVYLPGGWRAAHGEEGVRARNLNREMGRSTIKQHLVLMRCTRPGSQVDS